MVRRLVDMYSHADREAKAQGITWYTTARATCRAMAKARGTTLAKACGVVAALSPRLTWTRNVSAAEEMLTGIGRPTGVFSSSAAKAQRIINGAAPLTVLSGPKVRAFYRALMGDESAAVIDVWVARVVGWTRQLRAKGYAVVARALELAARLVRTTVTRLQAAVWVVIRGRA